MEVVLLFPLCELGACADAIDVAAARIRRAIPAPIAFLDAFLSNGIISFMLNRRLNPPGSSGFMPVNNKEMLFVP